MTSEPPRVDSLPRADIDFEGLGESLKPLGNPTRLKLLHYLTRPHYLEEIASALKMSRQAAQKHIDRLLELGVIKKHQGVRDSGPVVEYLVVPQRIFSLSEEFDKLGVLKPLAEDPSLERTSPGTVVPESSPGREPESDPHVVIVHGMRVGTRFPLVKGDSWLVGRDARVDVPLDYDPFASNRHAEIRRGKDGFVLADAYSTNGTSVNWVQLARGETVPLRTGDVIGVGKTLLLLRES